MDSETFVVGCTHFNHKNIIRYTGRPFSGIKEMNETMIENWNKVVLPDDRVWHLGDFIFANVERTQEILERLNGRKCLILGNHDNRKPDWYTWAGFDIARRGSLVMGHLDRPIVLTHRPLTVKEENGSGVLSQIALLEALRRRPYSKALLNVHAHIHEKDPDKPRRINVCVEKTDYRPVHLEKLVEEFEEKEEGTV